MERVVLTLVQLFLPLGAGEAAERSPGAAAPSETPKGWEELWRARAPHGGQPELLRGGLGHFRGEK